MRLMLADMPPNMPPSVTFFDLSCCRGRALTVVVIVIVTAQIH